jgi:hypothetical protein
MPASEPTRRVELFGGAVSASFPTRYHDVSDFRPVPDNQEAWTDASADESVIVEIVERVERDPMTGDGPSDEEGAAAWFWRDLADVNDASVSSGASELVGVTKLAREDDVPVGVRASTSITNSTEDVDARNDVFVVLACVRLPRVASDVLVTLNRPLAIAAGSQTTPQTGSGAVADAAAVKTVAEETLRGILSSLAIEDWGLFG